MCPINLLKLCSRVLVAMLTGSCIAAAQEASTIFVVFEADVPAITAMLDDPVTTASDTAEQLAASLSKRIKFWNFKEGAAGQFPRLRIVVRDDAWYSMRMMLSLSAADPEREVAGARWFEEGYLDTHGFPAEKDVPASAAKAFTTGILEAAEGNVPERVIEALKRVPLGRSALPTTPVENARAVLPLIWDRYFFLSNSEFLIRCNTPGGTVWLHSVGTMGQIPHSAGFRGLEVKHVRYIFAHQPEDIAGHLSDLVHLTPEDFFLARFEDAMMAGPEDSQPQPLVLPTGENP